MKINFTKLKREDVLIINKEEYQIINRTYLPYFKEEGWKAQLEMVKVKEPSVQADYYLGYSNNEPDQIIFFTKYNKEKKKSEDIPIKSIQVK